MPHKANAARRHSIPRPKRRVTTWAEDDAALRQRGSLTVWLTDDVIAAWRAAPRTTPGGQPHSSDLAITTALTLRTVFRLPLRQTEGRLGSSLKRLGLDLPVPDPSTRGRRARSLELPAQPRATGEPLDLRVDNTGRKLCGPGAGRVETHGPRKPRSWRHLHIAMDAATGRIGATTLTGHGVDDASPVGSLLDQVADPGVGLTGDGAFDSTTVDAAVHERHPAAAVVVSPRAGAVPSGTADTEPTQRDHHIRIIAETGRLGWQALSQYTQRAKVEGQIGRFKKSSMTHCESTAMVPNRPRSPSRSLSSTTCSISDVRTPCVLPDQQRTGG